jgi:hypothetical protein
MSAWGQFVSIGTAGYIVIFISVLSVQISGTSISASATPRTNQSFIGGIVLIIGSV